MIDHIYHTIFHQFLLHEIDMYINLNLIKILNVHHKQRRH